MSPSGLGDLDRVRHVFFGGARKSRRLFGMGERLRGDDDVDVDGVLWSSSSSDADDWLWWCAATTNDDDEVEREIVEGVRTGEDIFFFGLKGASCGLERKTRSVHEKQMLYPVVAVAFGGWCRVSGGLWFVVGGVTQGVGSM